jgi:hypothetical protein
MCNSLRANFPISNELGEGGSLAFCVALVRRSSFSYSSLASTCPVLAKRRFHLMKGKETLESIGGNEMHYRSS